MQSPANFGQPPLPHPTPREHSVTPLATHTTGPPACLLPHSVVHDSHTHCSSISGRLRLCLATAASGLFCSPPSTPPVCVAYASLRATDCKPSKAKARHAQVCNCALCSATCTMAKACPGPGQRAPTHHFVGGGRAPQGRTRLSPAAAAGGRTARTGRWRGTPPSTWAAAPRPLFPLCRAVPASWSMCSRSATKPNLHARGEGWES